MTLSKMKNKTLPTCLKGSYRDSLGEFNNTPYEFGAERVKRPNDTLHLNKFASKYKNCFSLFFVW